MAGRARPLVIACDIFLRSIAITSAWRTRTSSKRRDLGVEGVDRGAGTGIGVHGQLRVLLRLLDIVGVVLVVPDQVGLAGLQAGEARLRVGQRLQHDAVEIGLVLVPVVRILLQHHAVAGGPGLQDVGTGADGIAVVVVALGLPGRRRVNRHCSSSVDAQERRQVHRRIVQIIDDRQFVGRLHVVDDGDIEGAAALVGGILLPVEIPLHGLRIERRAVVELDAGTQLEGPGLEVVGMGPGQRELRLRPCRCRREWSSVSKIAAAAVSAEVS